jgi:undecaprenyl-diphosphatase
LLKATKKQLNNETMILYSFTIEFFASFAIWLMFAGILVLWVADGKIKREEVLHAVLAFIFAWLVAETIKRLIPTLRPFVVNGQGVLTLTKPGDGSFPSGHTASAFALSTTIWLHDKKAGWFYLILASLVGIARILANVHYPVDILGGVVIGILASFLIERVHLFKLLARFRKKIRK